MVLNRNPYPLLQPKSTPKVGKIAKFPSKFSFVAKLSTSTLGFNPPEVPIKCKVFANKRDQDFPNEMVGGVRGLHKRDDRNTIKEIQRRIEEGIEQHLQTTQYGFRKNRGTQEALYNIRRVITSGESSKTKTFC